MKLELKTTPLKPRQFWEQAVQLTSTLCPPFLSGHTPEKQNATPHSQQQKTEKQEHFNFFLSNFLNIKLNKMKTLFTFFIFSLLAFSSKAQWIELDPGIEVPYFSDVYAITSETVIVVGANGTILKTTDGGETWQQKESGVTSGLNKVQFPTPEIGYAVGYGGTFLKTTDGGENWVSIDTGQTAIFEGLSIVDESLIYVSYSNKLLKSEDGGNSWSNYTLDFYTYGEIQFLDNQKGFVSSSSGIMYTENGGTMWQDLGGIAPFQFLNESIGFYYNQGLYKTINGGGDFELLGVGEEWDLFSHIFIITENIGWGLLLGNLDGDGSTRGILKVTASETVPYTEDIWYDNNPEIDMLSIHFANETTGYIAGVKNGKGAIWKNGTGINAMNTAEESSASFKIYPNPASKEINIAFDDSFSGTISLNDLTGKQVYSSALTNKHDTAINVENLPQGTYILSVKSKQGNFSQKLIIN